MTLRERIKDLCKKNGISINKLEKECGFGTGYVSKLDKSTPNSENIQKIADFFRVTVDYLLTGKTTEEKIKEEFSPEQSELDLRISQDLELKSAISKYFSLSDKKKQHVIELIELLSGEE